MDNDKVPEQIKELALVEDLTKDLQALVSKYNSDMVTLNRILSTYEDELSSLKTQFFDLSYKFKQATQTPASE